MAKSKKPAARRALQGIDTSSKKFAEAFHQAFSAARPVPTTAKANAKVTWEITKKLAAAITTEDCEDLYQGPWTPTAEITANESALHLFEVTTGEKLDAAKKFEFATNLSRHGDNFYLTGEYVYGFGGCRTAQMIALGAEENLKLAEFLFSLHKLELCNDATFYQFTGNFGWAKTCCLLLSSSELLVASDGWRVVPDDEVASAVDAALDRVCTFFKSVFPKIKELEGAAAMEVEGEEEESEPDVAAGKGSEVETQSGEENGKSDGEDDEDDGDEDVGDEDDGEDAEEEDEAGPSTSKKAPPKKRAATPKSTKGTPVRRSTRNAVSSTPKTLRSGKKIEETE